MVSHAYNPSTQEAEAGGLQGQLGLHNEILSQKLLKNFLKKKRKKKILDPNGFTTKFCQRKININSSQTLLKRRGRKAFHLTLQYRIGLMPKPKATQVMKTVGQYPL
jgi:hypothetical protein